MKHLVLYNKEYKRLEESFKEWLQVLCFEPTTIQCAPIQLREFFYWLEGKNCIQLKDITPEHIREYFVYLSQRPNRTRGGGLSTNYLRKQLQVLNKFSRYLRETGQHPIEVPVHLPGQSNNIKTILTKAEIKLLYQSTDDRPAGMRDRAMLGIYYGCGLRRSEGVNLEVSDILFEKNMLYVRKGKNYKERYVPITQAVKEDLELYIAYARPQLLRKNKEGKAFFINAIGTGMKADGLKNRLKRLTEKAGIVKEISLHTLRHSIATHLLNAGMKLEDIKTFLGHTSIESTQIYTHIAHEQET